MLPSNGLTDLLEIAGRRVAASLPPTVRPGDVLQVRVTGFDGGRILLQIVATGADAAVEPGPPNVPLAPDRAAFVAASIRPPTPTARRTRRSRDGRAPPHAAARGAGGAARRAAAARGAADAPGITPEFTSAVSRANVAPSQAAARGGSAQRSDRATRRCRVRARSARRAVLDRSTRRGIARDRRAAGHATFARAAEPAPLARPAQPFVAPPQIAPKPVPSERAALRKRASDRIAPRASRDRARAFAHRPSRCCARSSCRSRRATSRPRRSRSSAPTVLPAALAALEAALPAASDDAHVATLRTLLAFVGRIDPRSPALATQIAAYVEHVVDGTEPKLATLLAATRDRAAPPRRGTHAERRRARCRPRSSPNAAPRSAPI